jgi:hypothetical protein
MAMLKTFADVRYEAIDDLIVPGLYTVTLTLAFTRGMRRFGEAMVGTFFMYWNADFVIGDGSLTHLVRCIQEGRKVVLAGSIRVISEEVEPLLRPKVAADGVLTATPRELSGYVFDHPHLMQVAKTVNQDFCWAKYPNHMFWKVDDQTLLARFFQIFMFCLSPTRVLTTIDGYCDYSFVPAFCPGEPIYVVGDSDEICLLEMQERWQEANDVMFGPGREDAWLQNLDEWCTPEHAEIARRPIIYHGGDIGPSTPALIAQSADYVEDFISQIRDPAPHPGHYYWVYGVAAWRLRRTDEEMLAGWPPELDMRLPVSALKHPSFDYDRGRRAMAPIAPPEGWFARLRRALVGEAPDITRLHPDFAALAPLIHAAKGVKRRLDEHPNYRVLVVAEMGSWIDRILSLREGHIYRTEPLVAATWRFEPQPGVNEVVIYCRGNSASALEAMLKNVAPALKPGGRLTVLRHYPIYDDAGSEQPRRDQLGFAAASYDRKVAALHMASESRRRYGVSLGRNVPLIHTGSFGARIAAAVRCVLALSQSYAGSRPAYPAALVLTARASDPHV